MRLALCYFHCGLVNCSKRELTACVATFSHAFVSPLINPSSPANNPLSYSPATSQFDFVKLLTQNLPNSRPLRYIYPICLPVYKLLFIRIDLWTISLLHDYNRRTMGRPILNFQQNRVDRTDDKPKKIKLFCKELRHFVSEKRAESRPDLEWNWKFNASLNDVDSRLRTFAHAKSQWEHYRVTCHTLQ